jgi:two-component system sensor histidine kinase CpxA
MRVRFPLYAKILLWFLLNLLFLGVVFYAFIGLQFHIGLDSLLLARTGDRIQAVGDIIATELGNEPANQWDNVLQRFGSAYKVTLLLFRSDGSQAAGQRIQLPPDMMPRLGDRRGGPLGFGARGARGDRGTAPPPGFPSPGPPPGALFTARTENPTRYWVGVRILVPDAERQRSGPMTLVAMSHSLWGGGLFFDPMPWVAVGAGVVFLSVLFWFPLVRGVTRSISQVTKATERIAEGRFDARVDAGRGDELGRLGQAINQMAARLDGFVTGQKRFLGDIAHELCSPLARMQVALGILEQRASKSQDAYVEDVHTEVQNMSDLVNELLSFSKASLKAGVIALQPVNVLEVVSQAVHREAGAEDKINVEVAKGIFVLAQRELLLRSLANLVRNAVRYAGEYGPITISAIQAGELVVVSVVDCGPGVPEETLARLFDPFYRPEPSRSTETGGVGLGLAIVKTCVESCQGTVACRNHSPSGLEVTIRLKAASEADKLSLSETPDVL